jgi:hypothetical protein
MATTQNICESNNDIKKLIMLNGCFSVKFKEKILAELCCLNFMAYPLDGFERRSEKIKSGATLQLFDNSFDLSPDIVNDNVYSGAIVYIHYPTYDSDGILIEDTDKNVTIVLGDVSTTFNVPIFNYFSFLSNPLSGDNTKFVNTMAIANGNPFDITAEILTIKIPNGGMDLTAAASGC